MDFIKHRFNIIEPILPYASAQLLLILEDSSVRLDTLMDKRVSPISCETSL
ncbi:hypothetical protein V1477_008004 [Vespula maculifrons]|uniref:Uncharacterized protein n=1 Tax=Vespula maculifrons TaxID=7453 RepID=A0ABD2CFF0_VESMC